MDEVKIEPTRTMDAQIETTRTLSTDLDGEPRQPVEDSPEPDDDEGAED